MAAGGLARHISRRRVSGRCRGRRWRALLAPPRSRSGENPRPPQEPPHRLLPGLAVVMIRAEVQFISGRAGNVGGLSLKVLSNGQLI